MQPKFAAPAGGEPRPEAGREHVALEQDIERLSAEIKERGLAEKGKEGVKTVVKDQTAPEMPIGPSGRPELPTAPPPLNPALPNYLQNEPAQVKLKVEKLLDLAFHQGIKRAAAEARESGPIILDAFHDALTDKIYNELKQKGLL